jgi:hypothetical protein
MNPARLPVMIASSRATVGARPANGNSPGTRGKLAAANRAEAVCRYLRMEAGNAPGRSQPSNSLAVPGQRW